MLDGIVFEKVGIPAASIVTDVFEATGRAMAQSWGVPEYRFLALPHPIANLTEAELDAARARDRARSRPPAPERPRRLKKQNGTKSIQGLSAIWGVRGPFLGPRINQSLKN